MSSATPQAAASARLRILCVIPGDGAGASFIFARRQVESIGHRGVNAEIFFLRSRTNPWAIFREWLRLRKVLRSFHPHVLHAHYGTMTSLLCVLASRVPLVITFRGSDLVPARGVPRLRAWLGILFSQVSAPFAKQIICTGERLRQCLWWQGCKAVVLPSGVNLRLFRPFSRAEARQALGWELDQKVVLFSSGGRPIEKGLNLAQKAVSVAESDVGALQFVHLKGEVSPDEMPLYMNAADCLVLASESEGSPNVVKEALACNLPIAAVDVGDVAERLRGVNPSRVVQRDADQLGRAIAEIVGQHLRSNGRDYVRNCSEEYIAERLREIYETVCDQHSAAPEIRAGVAAP